MDDVAKLKADYPWVQTPLVVSAPMRLIALADMAFEVSKAGGIGFIGAGTDPTDLSQHLEKAQSLISQSHLSAHTAQTLPLGLGFINWGAPLSASLSIIEDFKPAAVWFFAASSVASLGEWMEGSRKASSETRIWVQVGSVEEVKGMLREGLVPDVLVVQGTDAGGHGLAQGAGVVSLVPEVKDVVGSYFASFEDGRGGGKGGSKEAAQRPIILAAGGISDARTTAAALCLGAAGVVMGTRFLASPEANISQGYRDEVVRASDGGQTTVRTKVYDRLRGTTGWAETHNARGVVNRSFVDAEGGMSEEENRKLYGREVEKGDQGWGAEGRMTTYAGSGVGLVREVVPAGEIVVEVREGAREVLRNLRV